MSLNVNSKVEGTLFTISAENRRANGPVMEGDFQITGEAGKIRGACWSKVSSEKGTKYLSLQLEISRELKYYGAIFATREKTSDKAPDYFGNLSLGKGDNAPELRIAGWKRKGKQPPHTPFISVIIEPQREHDAHAPAASAGARTTRAAEGLPI